MLQNIQKESKSYYLNIKQDSIRRLQTLLSITNTTEFITPAILLTLLSVVNIIKFITSNLLFVVATTNQNS